MVDASAPTAAVPLAASALAASAPATKVMLDLEGVTKRYGALVAVDNVTMRVADGEVRAVIGPNGAGKTTLFHTITGVVKPTAGRVRFERVERSLQW